MELPKRKNMRLNGYDYSANGAYFITICTKDRHELLWEISVGGDAHITPIIKLSEYGFVVQNHMDNINAVYSDISFDKYIIMPNHVHLILFVNYNGGECHNSNHYSYVENDGDKTNRIFNLATLILRPHYQKRS